MKKRYSTPLCTKHKCTKRLCPEPQYFIEKARSNPIVNILKKQDKN